MYSAFRYNSSGGTRTTVVLENVSGTIEASKVLGLKTGTPVYLVGHSDSPIPLPPKGQEEGTEFHDGAWRPSWKGGHYNW